MNTKHTPGPLHVGDGKRALIVYRADGYAVADCKNFHGRISQDEAEANAVLFAAAPELLEALKAIRAARDYHAEHGEYPVGVETTNQCFDDWAANVAETAIAKAEGR